MTQDDEHLIADLLPCPFCGGLDLEDNLNSVNCETCGGGIRVAWSPGEDSDPVGAWNTRTEPPSPLSGRVERLEQALREIIDLFEYEYPVPLRAPSIARAALGDGERE